MRSGDGWQPCRSLQVTTAFPPHLRQVWLHQQRTGRNESGADSAVSYTHLRAHETVLDLVCRLLLEKKNIKKKKKQTDNKTKEIMEESLTTRKTKYFTSQHPGLALIYITETTRQT